MGMIKAHTDEELQQSYLYKRDFSVVASPLEDNFTFDRFSNELTDRSVNLKTTIVGKDAVVVGLGNAAFQDILYYARIHPKRKSSELNPKERRALFNAIKYVVQQRIDLGGKNQFVDLYGKQGNYVPAMGPNMRNKNCTTCGTAIEKMSLGGGQVYFCANCQKGTLQNLSGRRLTKH
jgi:formamidopyrimidine-DNA glycosylase